MAKTDNRINTHPSENDIADYLAHSLPAAAKKRFEDHVAGCYECLAVMASAYEACGTPGPKNSLKKKSGSIMKRLNSYLILAVLSFALSFVTPR